MIVDKANSDLFGTIAAGDTVETWDGIWGKVTAVEMIGSAGWCGPVHLESIVTIASEHLPSFDRDGWPTSYPGTITRTVSRFSTDLRRAYTPGA